jgi:hypothetical protein
MRLMPHQIPSFGFAAPKQGRIGPPWKQKIGIWWGTSEIRGGNVQDLDPGTVYCPTRAGAPRTRDA